MGTVRFQAMATASASARKRRGADPLVQALLKRLAGPDHRDGSGPADADEVREGFDFLPDMPSAQLLPMVSKYHLRGIQVGFPELMNDCA